VWTHARTIVPCQLLGAETRFIRFEVESTRHVRRLHHVGHARGRNRLADDERGRVAGEEPGNVCDFLADTDPALDRLAVHVAGPGVDGFVVSNHGGRQVDEAASALEALPDVADAVEDERAAVGGDESDDFALLFDGGIRRGSDAIKALALGADAVLLGRPYVYGLAIDSEDGVREVIRNFLADLDPTLALAGQHSVPELDRSVLVETDLL
jgi:hypothetical protein